jgi:pilus assembly protein Flp/PilA
LLGAVCSRPHRQEGLDVTLPLHAVAPARERGASAVEYGLLVAGVAALIVAVVLVFGGGVTVLFSDTCTAVQTARQSASCTP